MSLTAAEWQAEIASDVGQTGNLTLEAKVATWWEMAGDYAYDLRLQYLQTLKKAILWLVGQDWDAFDWAEGDVQKKESQKVAALLKLLSEVKEEIESLGKDRAAPITHGKIEAGGPLDPRIASGEIDTYPYPYADPLGGVA